MSGRNGANGNDRFKATGGGGHRRDKYGAQRGDGSGGVLRLGDVVSDLGLWATAICAVLAVAVLYAY
jgi:hypothetical protein